MIEIGFYLYYHMNGAHIRFLLAQLDFRVGDLIGNQKKIRNVLSIAEHNGIELVVFPEMALPGYPIQDLIFDRDFFESQQKVLLEIAKNHPNISIILGGFGIEEDPSHFPKYQNAAYVLHGGTITNKITKRLIPTYDVFDEKRYFWAGNEYNPILIKNYPIGVAICEDLWEQEYQTNVAEKLVNSGAKLILSINGSPYYCSKQQTRENLIQEKSKKFQIPIIYLNMVGGQDELVFDGRSFITEKTGEIMYRAPFCKEILITGKISTENGVVSITKREELPSSLEDFSFSFSTYPIHPSLNQNQEIVEALVLNLRDYYEKTGIFNGMVISLSGGVDSAFTLYIASRAISPEKVTAILLPSRYSSEGSVNDSIQLCNNLGIKYHTIPINEAHALMEKQFDVEYTEGIVDSSLDLAKQNLQSRLRGIYVMYYSNLYGYLVVSTGNKSEIATGYCTLYGDTNGGKNVPGDLYKTQLYDVCEWINRDEEIIPRNIIEKPPSAELKPNQVDQDNLPPYALLDEVLALRIDEGLSPREILSKGYDADLVQRIEHLYTKSEYKRGQLCQTIKINKKTFGKGRKIPVLKRASY